jgi:hypothetical protein
MVEELGPGIWAVRSPLSLAGAQFGTRMTVVRIGGDGLVLIAPCPIDEALAAQLAELGSVRALIAPNAFHHFYLLDAAKRYPEAAVFLAEGVAAKLGKESVNATTLATEPDPLWKAELEQLRIDGAPSVNEVVFYHAASRFLILTDLCFNFDPAPTGWTGFFLRLAGAHGRLAVSRLMRFLLKERDQVRASVKRVFEWDFDGIVVTHGEVLRRDGPRLLAEATADL